MTIPLSTFRGTLRQVTPATLNQVGLWMVRMCAPQFLPLSDEQAQRVLEKQRENISRYITHVFVPRQRFRRFSGDHPVTRQDERLDVGRCYSVCEDESGFDGGTLAEELNAYRNPAAEFYTVFFDCLDEESASAFGLPVTAHIGVAVLHPDRFVEALAAAGAPDQVVVVGQEAARVGAPLVVTLGNSISAAKIEGVLDLRQIDAQDWFFHQFVPRGIIPTDAKEFVDILPELVQPSLGGCTGSNQRLQFVGKWMREHLVNALIYPSARNDVYATYEKGELARWRGWNMVIYQGAPPPEGILVDMGGLETEFPRPALFQRRERSGDASFEWRIVGLQYRNHAIYDQHAPKPS